MYHHGHWGLGLLLYAPIVVILLSISSAFLPHLIVGAGIIAFTSSLPDIDMQLKDWTPIKHRGITHTVWFALFIGVVVAIFAYALGWYSYHAFGEEFFFGDIDVAMTDVYVFTALSGFFGFYGTVSHFLGDMITPMGLRPFGPVYRKRYCFEMEILGQRSKAANPYWNWGFYIIGSVVCFSSFIIALPEARQLLIELILYIV